MNTQEKKEALVQAVEEIAKKEAAYWEGNPKMQETFRNCYVSTAKTTTKFLESGEAYVFTGDCFLFRKEGSFVRLRRIHLSPIFPSW